MIPEVVPIACDTEALVNAARAGNEADLLALWTSVRRLVYWCINRWIRSWGDRGGVTAEDLEQAAFVALLQAVQGYEDNAGTFVAYYVTCVTREFSIASGCRTPKQRRDPLHKALSLDAPLSLDEPDGACLLDIIPDPRDSIADAEDLLFQEELATTIRGAVDALPAEQASVVRARYFENTSRAQLATEAGVSATTIRDRERRALTRLRKRSDLRSFAQELNFYNGTDLARFRITGTSSTERHALQLLGYSA